MDYIKIGSLTFQRNASLADMRLESCSIFKETAQDCASLAFDTMSAELFTMSEGSELQRLPANTPVIVYRDDKVYARFLKTSVSRTGPNTYTIAANSPLSILAQMPHPGGIYTGQTVKDIVSDICGDIPVMVESVFADIKLYGWLPYVQPPQTSARDNLAQVLFAIGAHLGTDLNGVLRVEKLWNGIASTVQASYNDGRVKYDTPVSAVTVTEHQYAEGSEEQELFNGTAEAGHLVTFSEPMHALTANGFTILEAGANYAKISAGSGTLKGRKYIHNTRQVTQTVIADAAENVKSFTDATLVSLTNSVAIAKRLAEYYRYRSTISEGIVAGKEKPGHVVNLYDPYDKKMVSACIQSLDTTISTTLKSDITALVGFTPPQPEAAEYFDERVVLTGSGEWEVPEGVTAITAVLIGGAQGGHCGYGGNPAELKTFNDTETVLGSLIQHMTTKWATGGKGGKGGIPGSGGKILQATLDVSPTQKFSFSCGVGGLGAAFDTNNWANTPDTPGADGTPTTFGALSSINGATSDIGYTDPTTGEVFANKGDTGIAGGDGAGADEDAPLSRRYTPILAGSVTDEDGRVWYGGSTRTSSDGGVEVSAGDEQSFTGSLSDGYSGGGVTYNCGSGAAAGASGTAGNEAGTFYLGYSPRSGMPKTSITVTARGSASVPGASATLVPKKPTVYGKGGRGGYGGGGDGATGISQTYYGGSKSGTLNNYPGSVRTTGSNGAQGGPGGDGCIILYYRKPKPVQSGALKTSDGRDLLDVLDRRMIV